MEVTDDAGELKRIPLNLIVAGDNPRTYFDPHEMSELVESIRANGIAQPILVRPRDDGTYQIVAGERRVRASRIAHGEEWSIPALIRESSSAEALRLSLVENADRVNPSAAEEARAAHRVLLQLKGDHHEAALQLGWPLAKLRKRLALLTATSEVLDALTARTIQLGHAELLASVAPEKQGKALALIIEHKLPVDAVRQRLAQMAHSLAAAIFDKAECATCRFNSEQQAALFGTVIDSGYCTEPTCYQRKTDAHLEGVRSSLAEEVPMVVVLRADSGITPIKLVVGGTMGVGAEQAAACRSCANFGCTVSGVVGSLGHVESEMCFDSACNSLKVAANLKATQDEARAATASSGTGTASTSTTKPANKPRKATAQSVASVPQPVRDYRIAQWRAIAAKAAFANPAKATFVLIGLGLSGNARHIEANKLGEALTAFGGSGSSDARGDLREAAHAAACLADDLAPRMLHAMAASAFKGLDERQLRGGMEFLGVNLADYWRLNAEFLTLMTKSEIEALAEEVGLDIAMGTKTFKKAFSLKKPDLIKALLAVSAFPYQGTVPAVMDYRTDRKAATAPADAGGASDEPGSNEAARSTPSDSPASETQVEAVAA